MARIPNLFINQNKILTMNYLDTTKNGGHPLYLEDLGFIQDAYKEAIAGITQGLGADSYILSGCQKTTGTASNTWNISAGFVVLDGEVFKVGAHTVNYISVNDPLYFKIHTATIYPSPAIYHDMPGDGFDVHHRRTAIVTTEVTEWQFELPTTSILIERISRRQTGKINLYTGFYGDLGYEVIGGICYLNGWIQMNYMENGNVICSIPSYLMPKFDSISYSGTMPQGTENHSFNFWVREKIILSGSTYSQTSRNCEISFSLSDAPPRNGILKIQIPTSSWEIDPDYIECNFFNISWPIAPR